MDNANKFADNIYISSYILNKKWLISIEDNGPGTSLSEEQLVKPFTKGSEQLNKGTGLGLFIVSEIIKFHGGKVSCRENQPKGSIFDVQFKINNE